MALDQASDPAQLVAAGVVTHGGKSVSDSDSNASVCHCVECRREVPWSGQGRKPLRCAECNSRRRHAADRYRHRSDVASGDVDCPHCNGRCLDCGGKVKQTAWLGCVHYCQDCLDFRSAVRRTITKDIDSHYCTECGSEIVKLNHGRWPLTCGEACADKRKKRLAKPKPQEQRICECGNPLEWHKRYCSECGPRIAKEKQKAAQRRRVGRHGGTKCDNYRREWYKTGCFICGVYAVAMMDAHHVAPDEKEHNVGRMKNLDALIEELSKCVPLCKNHHALVHNAMQNGGSGLGWDAMVEYVRETYPQTC